MSVCENLGNDGASLEAPFPLQGRQIVEEGGVTMDHAYRMHYTIMVGQNEARDFLVEQHEECVLALEQTKARLSEIYRKLRAHEFDPEGPDEAFISAMQAEQTSLDGKRILLQDRLDELTERLHVATMQHQQRTSLLQMMFGQCSVWLRKGIQQEEGS